MPFFDKYELSPGVVASFTEPTPDLQRNYRQRGMMDSYGHADAKGRWMYSLHDLVGIWISDRLSQRGYTMDRRDALRHGYACAPGIIENAIRKYSGQTMTGERFSGFIYKSAAKDGELGGVESASWHSLLELEAKEFDRVEVMDLHRLARVLPSEILALLITAYEDDLANNSQADAD